MSSRFVGPPGGGIQDKVTVPGFCCASGLHRLFSGQSKVEPRFGMIGSELHRSLQQLERTPGITFRTS
jgi:hypothetical protein